MTALIGSLIGAVCLLWITLIAVLAVREMWRDCVRARRARDVDSLGRDRL